MILLFVTMRIIMLLLLIATTLIVSISGFVAPTKCSILQQQYFRLGSSPTKQAAMEGKRLEKNARIAELEIDLEAEKSKVENLQNDFETLLTLVKDAQTRENDLLENLSVLEANAGRDESIVSEATQSLNDARQQLTRALDRCTKAEEYQAKSIQTQKDRLSSLATAKQDIQQHSETIKCLKEQLESFQGSITNVQQGGEERSRKLAAIESDLAEKEQERQRVEAQKKIEAKAEQRRQKEEALQAKIAAEELRKKEEEAKKTEKERQKIEALKQKKEDEAKKAEEERQKTEATKQKKEEEADNAKEERERIEAMKLKEAEEAKAAEEERQKKKELQRLEAEKEAERAIKEAEQARLAVEALEKEQQEKDQKLKEKSKQSVKKSDLPAIDKWKITSAGEVMGVVTGHAAMEDSDIILTSRLKNPSGVAENTVVTTESGSQYFLAKREKNVQPIRVTPSSYAKSLPVGGKTKDTTGTEEALTFFKKELGLSGKKLTGSKSYFLAGKPTTTSSGRSKLWTAYLEDARSGLPTGDPLAVKISSHREGMERDNKNYKKITSGFLRNGEFCRQLEFIPSVDWNKNECALIMDKGKEDLKEFIDRQIDGLKPRDLRDAASAAAQCLDAIHGGKLVWTDLKTENFVVFDTEDHVVVKGIDLESSMPMKSNPVDYSPEACPPEFAKSYLGGEGSEFVLESSYDIWSFGMLMYELATGRGYFESESGTKMQPTQIMKALCDIKPDVSVVKDENLRNLISQCLSVDPKKRPTISQVLRHPYFLTIGLYPFRFFL
mmetsp:Transcript_29310/g.43237  ORF Transcript_29310/g.43237 Transcript_29310/m.43237 type:complete len:783 (+) Transcript_29310:49-2397(+)